MNCPEIEQLFASPRRAGIDEHAACCDACGGMLGLSELREQIAERTPDDCVDAEVLIARREIGALPAADKQRLQAHLEECADCNELAVRMASLPSPVREATSVAAQTGVHQAPQPAQRTRPPLWWWLAAASFALFTGLVGLGMGLALDFGAETTAEATASPVVPTQVSAPASQPGHAAPKLPPVLTPFGLLPLPSVQVPQPDDDSDVPDPKPPQTDDDTDLLNPFQPLPKATATDGKGFLTIVCAPFCDRVVVDGKSEGRSPIVRHALDPGRHTVLLKRGTVSKTISVHIVAGTTTARRVNMQDGDADADGVGFLNVMCVPFCNKVVVAGVNLGSTPIVRRRLDPGRHNVELWRGAKRSVRTVHVRAGKTSTLTHRAPRATSCNPPYTIDKSGLKRMKPECVDSSDTSTPDPGARTTLTRMKNELKVKLASGKASESEKRMLRALCRQLGDRSCMN